MTRIKELLEQISDLTAEGEDGDDYEVEMQDPLSGEELENLMKQMTLPQELCDFYALSNGMQLLSEELYDADSLQHVDDIILFHSFDNGDFTCIATKKSEYPDGSILFMNHSPDVLVPVADSLYDWIDKVVAEIQAKGCLLHPADYFHQPDEQGVYSQVLNDLKGRDCELNS